MFLIVGLGNPGDQYEGTRHNLGFRVIDLLCERWGNLRLRESSRHSVYVRASRRGGDLLLAKPVTFMNRSGTAVAEFAREYSLAPGKILVVFDDNTLPTGSIRVRKRGGSGGHKGVRSIIDALGSEDFPRIRLGIGTPDGDTVDHVLSSFGKTEIPLVEESIVSAAEAVETFLDEGAETAMNRFNRRVNEGKEDTRE
jgi:PTH1 family peptidyl-tRNA hydrolase